MTVHPKTKAEQEVGYLHKSRQNVIQQRIQRSNSLMTSLMEFGYVVQEGKSSFAKKWSYHLQEAKEKGAICEEVYAEMVQDGEEIDHLLQREKSLDKIIHKRNKRCQKAQRLLTISGIGPINASILSQKPVSRYESAKDFAASLGLVPKQHTTGGKIQLGGITKQGDRYARTMLIQAGRSLVMRASRGDVPQEPVFELIQRLKAKGKGFNVICVAVANKLARIVYGCLTKEIDYGRW